MMTTPITELNTEAAKALAKQYVYVPCFNGVPYLSRSGSSLLLETSFMHRAADVDLVQKLRTAKLTPEDYRARISLAELEIASAIEVMVMDNRECMEEEKKAQEMIVQVVMDKEAAEKSASEAEGNVEALKTSNDVLGRENE